MLQVKIDGIDNGYIVSFVKQSALQRQPEHVTRFFATFIEVIEYLNEEFV